MALPYQAAVSGNAFKNKGSTILKAGNIASTSSVTQNFTQLESVTRPLTYGAKVILSSGSTGSSGNMGTFNAKTTFAYEEVPGRYIMKKYTNYVNGVADTSLRSCAAYWKGKKNTQIYYAETGRTLGSGISASFNPFTGTLTKGGNAGAASSFGTDDAAHPTNATPGELQYKTGRLLPYTDEYQPKYAP